MLFLSFALKYFHAISLSIIVQIVPLFLSLVRELIDLRFLPITGSLNKSFAFWTLKDMGINTSEIENPQVSDEVFAENVKRIQRKIRYCVINNRNNTYIKHQTIKCARKRRAFCNTSLNLVCTLLLFFTGTGFIVVIGPPKNCKPSQGVC